MTLLKASSLYGDLHSCPSPSLITGDSLKPDLVIALNNTTLHVLELTFG